MLEFKFIFVVKEREEGVALFPSVIAQFWMVSDIDHIRWFE